MNIRWSDILRSDLRPKGQGHLLEFFEDVVLKTGYKYFTWNDVVYKVLNSEEFEATNLRIQDLELKDNSTRGSTMSFDDLFPSPSEVLKDKLTFLVADKFPSSYKRLEQPEAKRLLEAIEKLEREHVEMKEKLEKINQLSK